jgi:hypothetical protein
MSYIAAVHNERDLVGAFAARSQFNSTLADGPLLA